MVSVFFSIPFFFGDQLKYFHEKEYEIHLICSPSNKLGQYAESQFFRYKEVHILRKFSIIQDLIAAFQIYKYIKANKFDVVCGHTPKAAFLSMIAAFLARTPKRIFFRHGLVYETSTGVKRVILVAIEKLTSFLATKVVCVSPYLIERSIKDGLTKKKKMILLNKGSCNGVDALGVFNPHNLNKDRVQGYRNNLGIPEGHFVIGYVGRLVKDKGIIELVDSFMNIVKQRPNVLLLLVGPEEARDSISSETRKIIKEEPRIIATGAVEKNIEYFYSLMDVLILPTHREGLGTTILEGSAMSKPVLTTAHTGSRDAMVDRWTGSHILMDSSSITNELIKYIENPELCRERGVNGRKFVLDNFQQQLIWQEIERKLYDE